MRRIGILLDASADDVYYQPWVAAFHQALAVLGWTIGRNVRVDTRWAAGEAERVRKYAGELVALAPDAHGAGDVAAMLQATRTVPIVFAAVTDPVGSGFVESLARP